MEEESDEKPLLNFKFNKRALSRKYFYVFLLGCLFAPLFLTPLIPVDLSFFSKCFFLTLFSGVVSFFILRTWEEKMKKAVSKIVRERLKEISQTDARHFQEEVASLHLNLENARLGYENQVLVLESSLSKSKSEVSQLHLEMDKKLDQMRLAYLEFDDLRKEYIRLEDDFLKSKEEAQKNRSHKEALINEYQKTISEQRMIIEKKQHYISKLEEKVQDLMYEIRSLLQLEESEIHKPSKKSEFMPQQTNFLPNLTHDLSFQLEPYLKKVEGLTGVDHLGYRGGKSPRFLDLSLENYAVDLRRLFDSFGEGIDHIIFIYSHKDKKLLFVSRYVKTLLGFSPEKFIEDFPHFIREGYLDFKNSLSKLATVKESQTHMVIQNKLGKAISVDCTLSLITKGPFVHNVIGIFLPS